jgi:molecular chaperone GrpE (heat shock protein)
MNGSPEPNAVGVLESIHARLGELTQEIRRQGRAAVAAQAAAESCLELLKEQSLDAEDAPDEDRDPPDEQSQASEAAWLERLLPVFDAIDRSVVQAESVAKALPGRRWLTLVPPMQAALEAAEATIHGLRLLRGQLDQALAQLGVDVDRETGCLLDPERHRVLEVRPHQHAPDNSVLEVMRPGYCAGGRRVRDTEVVVATGHWRQT